MLGWGKGRRGRAEPPTWGPRGLRRQLICSGGGGACAQKVQETGPRSHSVLRKGPGASRSAVFRSLTSLHHQHLCPCGKHLFSPIPRRWTPGLLSMGGAWPSPPSRPGQGPAAKRARGRDACFQTVAELRGASNMVLGQATSAWGPPGILQPQSPTGEPQTPRQGWGEERPS